jgi:large subunit ribosomal protein L15
MKLNQIEDNQGARTHRTRVGRGSSSGLGKTCGKGVKGQHARAGVAVNGFEGGQMPLYMRLPKRGFYNHFANEFAVINLGRIQAALDSGKLAKKDTITGADLKAAGLVSQAEFRGRGCLPLRDRGGRKGRRFGQDDL